MNVVNFPEIQALFPTPIGIYDLKEKLPYDELFRYCLMLEAEDKAKDHGLVKGEGVSSYNYSKNILDDHRFELVRTLITSQVKHFQNGIGIHTKLSLGRSWFNIQRTGSTITAHNHRRSVISGALYLHAEQGTSPITFKSPLHPYKMYEYTAQETSYNATLMETPCEQGTLVLFPSWLEHYTEENDTDNRVTVSFNTGYRH